MSTTSGAATRSLTLWQLDPAHTKVEFGVRHMMFSTVKGSFPGVEGALRFDPSDLGASSVEVRIDAASIDTGNADRDRHLRSDDFLDVENHPELTFRSTKVSGTPEKLQVEGELTIRGTTRPVTLEGAFLGSGKDPWGQERSGFHAETKIQRKEFGLTWNQALEAGGVLVGDEVRITLDVQAVRQDEAEEG